MTSCVYVCVCLRIVNVLVVCIVLHDGPGRRCLATCLGCRGLDHDAQCADVAERRPHSVGIVQTLRIEKKIGRETDRQTLAAFVLSVKMFGRLVVKTQTLSSFLCGDLKREHHLQNGNFCQTR